MTETNTGPVYNGRPGFGRQKRNDLRVDMTPMVDLGFILITFFVMTVQLSRPVTMNLAMPKDTDNDPTILGESNALSVLLDDKDRIYYYHGKRAEAVAKNQVYMTSYAVKDGLGNVIREKQKWLDQHTVKEGRNGLMLLVKPGKELPTEM